MGTKLTITSPLLFLRVEWKTVMDRFQREVKLIEEEANSFIDESFKSLRSAEGTFDMLHKFKNIHTRDAINTTMMKKFNEILKAFEKEVDEINELFEENNYNPPISKSQPPVAGAITWSRSLFQRIKHTVLRFQTKKELIDSDAGKAVSSISGFLGMAFRYTNCTTCVYTTGQSTVPSSGSIHEAL